MSTGALATSEKPLRLLRHAQEIMAGASTVEALLADVARVVSTDWPYRALETAGLRLDDPSTSDPEPAPSELRCDRAIVIDGHPLGVLSLRLSSRAPVGDRGWLQEERGLAECLAQVAEEHLLRREAQRRSANSAALLRALRNTNRLTVQATSRGQLISGVCSGLLEERGYLAVWIVLLDDPRPPLVAAAGVPEASVELRARLAEGHLPACARRALSSEGVHAISAPGDHCSDCALARVKGIRCGLAARISVGDRAGGVLAAAIPEARTDARDEEILLQEIVQDMGFALRSLEREERRCAAEEEARRSESRYRRLHLSMRDAFVQVDMDGRLTDWNTAYEEMLGYSAEELARLAFPDLTPSRWHDFEARIVTEEVLPTGQSRVYEKEYMRKDGTVFPVELRTFLLARADGSPEAMWAIVRDITDRKRATARLRRSRRELRLRNRIARVFLTVPDDGMYAAVLEVIREALRSPFGVFGYVDEQGALVVPTMTSGVWDQCRVSDKATVFPCERWGDSSWPTAIRERRLVHSNDPSTGTPPGHIRIRRHISLPIVLGSRAIGLIQVANKPTAYSPADLRLMETLGHAIAPVLHARVQRDRQEAARRAAERDLLSAVENLDRSNRDLEQFAYVASHDLQEPLRMVSSYTQLLAERYQNQLDDKARLYIHYAVDGALRMQQLITDLLTFSRVATRGAPFALIDSHEALGQAIAALALSIREVSALVTSDELPVVPADATQLTQVFQNLISNSIKFRRGDTPPRIHVTARSEGNDWLFSVNDNGIGIDPRYSAKIFAIFQRLHNRAEYPGTGIGLAICKRVIERHGGRIWFESEPGRGTTFRFTLPARRGKETDPDESRADQTDRDPVGRG